jgi:hypothetical protein
MDTDGARDPERCLAPAVPSSAMDGSDGWNPTCSRIGCDAPAAASFSFDALNCLAWLDTVVEARGAGFLCRDHAERLTPPRGWSLLDRRSPEPMLFVQRRAEVARSQAAGGAVERPARKSRAKRGRATRARHDGGGSASTPASDAETGHAATAAGGAVPELPFDEPAAAASTSGPRSWSVRDLPALDDEFDDRTPLLARAFESLRQSQSEAEGTAGDRAVPPAAT